MANLCELSCRRRVRRGGGGGQGVQPPPLWRRFFFFFFFFVTPEVDGWSPCTPTHSIDVDGAPEKKCRSPPPPPPPPPLVLTYYLPFTWGKQVSNMVIYTISKIFSSISIHGFYLIEILVIIFKILWSCSFGIIFLSWFKTLTMFFNKVPSLNNVYRWKVLFSILAS